MLENIELFTQSSIRIRSGQQLIYVDPFSMRESPHDADYILITHDHYDHFSPEDIEKVSMDSTVLFVPEKMEGQARRESGIDKVHTVCPGEHYSFDQLEFDTIPAYNKLKPFHPKSSGWVGYLLNINGKKIYIAGDTDKNKENQKVTCDIAMVPIGGTFTMDAKAAAKLINIIKPEIAIPTHYGSIVGKKEDARVFADYVKAPIKTEIIMQY